MNRKEEIDYFKRNIKINDIAKQYGFTVKKIGSYYTLKEHDSIRINPVKNCYWQNSNLNNKGSVFDFAIDMCGLTFNECIQLFRKQADISFDSSKQDDKYKSKPITNSKFVLPKKNVDFKCLFGYLIKTRCIDKNVVKDFIDRGYLYQDTNNNCVFVGYDFDKNPVYATKRGTNNNIKFFADVKGSDYSKCFFIDNDSDELVITESVIDTMSIISLSEEEHDYLALGGVGKWKCIDTYLYTNKYHKICISLDNDKAGKEAAQQIKDYILNNYSNIEVVICLPYEGYGKDWNDYLIHERTKENVCKKVR